MAMPMPEVEFCGYTTGSSEDEAAWNHWSPVVNWDALTAGSEQDGFHELMESMMDMSPEEEELACCNSCSSTGEEVEGNATTTHHLDASKGVRLVHLLMAAAESLNNTPDLARVILLRLNQLVSPTHGTNMERLAAYFANALHALLETAGPGGAYNTKHFNYTQVLTAFQLLQDMSPYLKFAHFTANQAIIEAVAQEKRVHIIDYDIMEGTQWASLMQALCSRKNGPHIRITALTRPGTGRRSMATVQETGRRLTAFAASIGQPLSFHQCRVEADETFRASALKLVRGEAVVLNCMLHLPHQSYRGGEMESVESFIKGGKELKARVVTMVEEEEGGRRSGEGEGEGGFVGRFMERLHHYSAMYDSLEAGFPMEGGGRALVERVFMGPRIAASLARIYKHQSQTWSWRECFTDLGYRGVDISFANHCQAKLLLGLFNDGYRVEESGGNTLVLSWKSTPLLSASVWTTSSSSSISNSTTNTHL